MAQYTKKEKKAIKLAQEFIIHDNISLRDLEKYTHYKKTYLHVILTKHLPRTHPLYPIVQRKLKFNYENRGIYSRVKAGVFEWK